MSRPYLKRIQACPRVMEEVVEAFMKKKKTTTVILVMICSLLLSGFTYPEMSVYAKGPRDIHSEIPENSFSALKKSSYPSEAGRSEKLPGMLFMPSPSDIGSQLDIFNRNKASSSEAIDISSPVDARNGVVRIFTTDDIDHPTSAATGSGFGVGVIGTETSVFLTNRHVVVDSRTGKIADHVYIMLNDNAVKEVYTPFGDFPTRKWVPVLNWLLIRIIWWSARFCIPLIRIPSSRTMP